MAGVTGMYRKYTDLYLERGRAGYRVDETDRKQLMDLYNRGGFHNGYYRQHNGKEMISKERPNHAGVAAVRVTGQRTEVTGVCIDRDRRRCSFLFRRNQKKIIHLALRKKAENVNFLCWNRFA